MPAGNIQLSSGSGDTRLQPPPGAWSPSLQCLPSMGAAGTGFSSELTTDLVDFLVPAGCFCLSQKLWSSSW